MLVESLEEGGEEEGSDSEDEEDTDTLSAEWETVSGRRGRKGEGGGRRDFEREGKRRRERGRKGEREGLGVGVEGRE